MRIVSKLFLILWFIGQFCPSSSAQLAWVSTATKAYPVQDLQNAVLIGPLASSTSLHVVVGLLMQNSSQVQPILKRMTTPGDPLYGSALTLNSSLRSLLRPLCKCRR